MKNGCNYFYVLTIVSLIILASGCTYDTPTKTRDEQPPDVTIPVTGKGDRLLGLGLTEGAVGFGESFNIAQDLGVQVVELSLAWDDIETAPGNYENEYLDIANAFYPPNNVQVSLSINPIDTNNLRLPPDLKDKDLDDPEVIERYNKLMDYVLSRTPELDLVSVNIGNEIEASYQEITNRELYDFKDRKLPDKICFKPIGIIHTEFKTLKGIPIQLQ